MTEPTIGTRDLIVATCAVVGAGLGVLNLVRTYLADYERLKVAVWGKDQDEGSGVEVINFSRFPVTVVKIGHVYPDGQVVEIAFRIEKVLPKRVEARDSHTFDISLRETIARQVYEMSYTFVRTALGKVFTSEPPLARWWRRARETLHLKSRDL
jgi:hypothetical protein